MSPLNCPKHPLNCPKYPLVRDILGNLRATFFVREMLEGFLLPRVEVATWGFTIVLRYVFGSLDVVVLVALRRSVF